MKVVNQQEASYRRFTITVQRNRNNPDKLVGFAGSVLCYFDRSVDTSSFKPGQQIDVIITKPYYKSKRNGDGPGGRSNIREFEAAWVIPVDLEKYIQVETEGFVFLESSGHRHARGFDPLTGHVIEIHTGYTGVVSSSSLKDLKPTTVWVLKQDLIDYKGIPIQAQGLVSLADAYWYQRLHNK